jgi:uncharacterized protein YukE
MMALPKQVQAQLAEVEELEKTLNAPKEKKSKPKVVEVSEDQTDTEAEVLVEAEEAIEPAEVKPADTSLTDVAANEFEQKYKTLRGKYDAEVPRLHQQVRDLSAQLEEFRAQLAEKPKEVEPTKAKEKVSYVTDADREEFGEELIDVQRRVAREVAQDYEDRFEQQEKLIQKLEAQLASTGSKIGEMSFSQKLAALVPDFAEIDKDERWIAWLNEYDPMLRAPRRESATKAFQAGDAEAVADYVNLFKQTLLSVEAVDPRQSRKAELEKQVAPNRSASSVATKSVGRDAKVYSEREIQGAWTKIRNLNSRNMYDEAAKLEAEITAAYLEGRVR